MISYPEALQIILRHAAPLQSEKLPLLAALAKIAAADITSAMDVPSFRNSAMDGFAIRRTNIASATVTHPVSLQITGTIAAGDIVASHGKDLCAVQITTGAFIPEPFDAVIPIEAVAVAGNKATFIRPAREYENIRFPGEDVRHGQTVLRRGEVITAEHIMLLASLGIGRIDTWKLPDLYLFATGEEIIDNTDTSLPEGKIYNSNAPYLMARCREEGFTAHYSGIIADDAAQFEERISLVKAGSIIVTTGAVSKGVRDFIPESLKRLGATTHFHRVNIRPGKPVLFATLPNGSWFFGLPGNPISAAIGFRFFVKPLLRVLQGLPVEQPIMARAENSFTKNGNFRQFLKTALKVGPKGELRATIVSGQESFKIKPLAETNAWVVLDEDRLECMPGSFVPVFFFGAGGTPLSLQPLRDVPFTCKN